MSIDPRWLQRYQKFLQDANQAVHDYMICLELEDLLKEEGSNEPEE